MSNGTVGVIGGGASGLMFACLAASYGVKVVLFEKNASERVLEKDAFFDNAYLGKKLLITGKGRCNLTNACSREEFMKNVAVNGKFLYAAETAFDSRAVMDFFASCGVELKTERGNRVFPASDKAQTILNAFKNELRRQDVTVLRREIVGVEKTGDAFCLTDADGASYSFDACVVATGGLSYPVTGSTGDGYRFAERFGHTVVRCRPSLVPVECEEKALCRDLTGVSLKNVTLTLTADGVKKPLYSELGEMLFTHFGVSGPLVLSASAHMKDIENTAYTLHIDLKPALTVERLDEKLCALFEAEPNKALANVLRHTLPQSLTAPFAKYAALTPDKKVNAVTKNERRALVAAYKDFALHATSLRPFEEAIITSGGVNVRETDPHTMMSKRVDKLYFIGEVLDLDAYTGGFNLQIAFSTAAAAARAVAGTIGNA